jgi:hypothetical protein
MHYHDFSQMQDPLQSDEFDVMSHSNTFYDWDIFLDNRDSYFTDHGFGSQMKAKRRLKRSKGYLKIIKIQIYLKKFINFLLIMPLFILHQKSILID